MEIKNGTIIRLHRTIIFPAIRLHGGYPILTHKEAIPFEEVYEATEKDGELHLNLVKEK